MSRLVIPLNLSGYARFTDVGLLVFDKENLLLVTSLNSEQALRTASVVDALGVVLVNSKTPTSLMMSLAKELDISVLSTPKPMFDTCAALHQLLNEARCGA